MGSLDVYLSTYFRIAAVALGQSYEYSNVSEVILKDTAKIICCSTHWGRVMHICISKLTIIGSDNGLSPGWHQAIIWTSAGVLLIGPLGTNFSDILTRIPPFSYKKLHLKMSSWKWRPFCLSLNVLTTKSMNHAHNSWNILQLEGVSSGVTIFLHCQNIKFSNRLLYTNLILHHPLFKVINWHSQLITLNKGWCKIWIYIFSLHCPM